MISPLQQVRSEYAPKLPPALRNGAAVKVEKGAPLAAFADAEKIELFLHVFGIIAN